MIEVRNSKRSLRQFGKNIIVRRNIKNLREVHQDPRLPMPSDMRADPRALWDLREDPSPRAVSELSPPNPPRSRAVRRKACVFPGSARARERAWFEEATFSARARTSGEEGGTPPRPSRAGTNAPTQCWGFSPQHMPRITAEMRSNLCSSVLVGGLGFVGTESLTLLSRGNVQNLAMSTILSLSYIPNAPSQLDAVNEHIAYAAAR